MEEEFKARSFDVASEKPSGYGSPVDIEKQPEHGEVKTVHLQRRLQSRHLQMIAIGGTIGTGLFIGSGGALAKSGPAGILIAYAFVGTLVYSVMVALGEMATYIPVSGAFTTYATRFVDPSLGFSMGWIYWFSWAITYALELTASGLIIQYWAPDLNIGIFIGVFWIVISAVNFLPVNFYGEVEFWFCTIKVITIVGFLIFAICIDAGAGQHGYLGFKYWHHPGAFAPYIMQDDMATAKFVGFWSVMITAGFSYQGYGASRRRCRGDGQPSKDSPCCNQENVLPDPVLLRFFSVLHRTTRTIHQPGFNQRPNERYHVAFCDRRQISRRPGSARPHQRNLALRRPQRRQFKCLQRLSYSRWTGSRSFGSKDPN